MEAFTADEPPVLLIDEIDKADIEFPNDLLLELDRMAFHVYETGETIEAKQRPIVMITSNNEKELPDAFLRRCFFHYIVFPDEDVMSEIAQVHYPNLKKTLLSEALNAFYEIRDVPGIKKRPSTSELLDWIKLLVSEDMSPEALRSSERKSLIPPSWRASQERAGCAVIRTSRLFRSSTERLRPTWASEMFINFFSSLKDAKLPVTLREYLTLMEAMNKGIGKFAVDDFYYPSRSCLIKDERNLDKFDRIFGECFEGLEFGEDIFDAAIPQEWLRKVAERPASEEEMAQVESLGGWESLLWKHLESVSESRKNVTRGAVR